MKYSEFLQLSELFESKGTTVYKELGLVETTLNEKNEEATTETPTGAEPAIDVEKTNVAQRVTRWGRIKNTLNKQGKKIQDQINKKENHHETYYSNSSAGEIDGCQTGAFRGQSRKNDRVQCYRLRGARWIH